MQGVKHTYEIRGLITSTLGSGKTHTIPITSLSSGFRDLTHRAWWLEPGKYTITASLTTVVSPAPANAKKSTKIGFGGVVITSAPVLVKVEQPDVKAKPQIKPAEPQQENTKGAFGITDRNEPAENKKARVLLFAGGPEREYQFVRSLFLREVKEKRMELSILLQSGEEKADVNVARLLTEFPDRLGIDASKKNGTSLSDYDSSLPSIRIGPSCRRRSNSTWRNGSPNTKAVSSLSPVRSTPISWPNSPSPR